MLLDLADGSLALYANGQRRGLLILSGLQQQVPLFWNVDSGSGNSIRMLGPKRPPDVPSEEFADEQRRWSEPEFAEIRAEWQERLATISPDDEYIYRYLIYR